MSEYDQCIEDQLFDYEDMDIVEDDIFFFRSVVLKVPVSEYGFEGYRPAGTSFTSATMNTLTSVITFENEDGEKSKYRLNVSVGKKIE